MTACAYWSWTGLPEGSSWEFENDLCEATGYFTFALRWLNPGISGALRVLVCDKHRDVLASMEPYDEQK